MASTTAYMAEKNVMTGEKRTASLIIIGGGVVACATAYNLAKRGMNDIIVLEKKEIGNGGSCRNAGGVRQSARDVRELPLAMYAVSNIWPTLGEELDVDVEYVRRGNIRMGKTEAHLKKLQTLTDNSRAVGLDVEMISGDQAREICPYMSEEVIGASWCPTDGHANPLHTTLGFYRKALEMGVTFVTGVEVKGIRKYRGRARFVDTDDGVYEGEQILLCAGWNSREIADSVGIELPIIREFSECLVTEMEPDMFPVMLGCADSDFYGGQTKHGSFVMGGNSGIEPYTSEKERFETNSLTAPSLCRGIIRYFPSLKEIKVIRTWAGWYDVCADHVPVIDTIDEVPGLVIAAGFCGHGFGISPAVGLAVSELVMDGKSTTIDISGLAYDRFRAKA
ncbi:MAG: NAD(P)/FAD-dependent oxidoreductase [Coriobacteriales bacterium]|jgi:sarcosine oxidase subunit beta